MGITKLLLLAACACDSVFRVAESWGLGLKSSSTEGVCPAGDKACPTAKGTAEGTRGASSRPGPPPDVEKSTQQSDWVPFYFAWFLSFTLGWLNSAARVSMYYCGTLCASIGLAARWGYWLATAVVVLFLIQLSVWTCNWVVFPLWRHATALWRYLRGRGGWYEVVNLHGIRVFRPKWIGPRGSEEWTSAYVQTDVRGRGDNRDPHDLLVTDGVAVARLRHGTLRGRTNRFGIKIECDSVHSASHRYFRHLLESHECKVHLCAQVPCGQADEDCVHVPATAVIPRIHELDLQDVAGRGPWGRCATAAKFWGVAGCLSLGQVLRWVKDCVFCGFCCRCCCSRQKQRRNSRGGDSEPVTPRHDNSETESEPEDDQPCQADSVAFLQNGRAIPLALTRCKDAARGEKVYLFSSDAEVSSKEDLGKDGDRVYFYPCSHHRTMYEGQVAKRTCAMEGCDREVKVAKNGVRLCKLHQGKEDKPRMARMVSKPLRDTEGGDTEERFAPGDVPPPPLPAPVEPPAPQGSSELLGKYLREILRGRTERDCFESCLTSGVGPRETWEELKEQATRYVTRLPRDYPPAARKAIVFLVTEDFPFSDSPLRAEADPVLGLASTLKPFPLHSSSPTVLAGPEASFLARGPERNKPNGQAALDPSSLFRPKTPFAYAAASSMESPFGPVQLQMETTASPLQTHQLPGSRAFTRATPNPHLSFAAASRPRHIGAYTDAEPLQLDETSKALQAIAKAVTSKDEAAAQEKGKVSSIGKVEERLVYLTRGCDAFTVPVGTATVGKELYHALRATATQGRPQLRAIQFPVNINNRIAYGMASMSFGGKDARAIPDYNLSAADFPLTSEEEFDNFLGSTDLKLEKRPKMPLTLNHWYRNALRQSWATACILGTEHYAALEAAATFLLKLGEEHSYMWPAHAIVSVWEELWSRFVEEMREVDRNIRKVMREDSPSFARMRFFATAPGPDGEPWLRLPRTFFLEDAQEYFQTDVIPRHNRLLSRACWQNALKKGSGLTLHGGKAGEESGLPSNSASEASLSRPEAKVGKGAEQTTNKPLFGPALSGKEAARSLDHRPKDRKKADKYLCWDYITHRGCNRPTACPHAHSPGPKWDSLDWTVQLQLLRRGGLKSNPKLTETQAVLQMEEIRKTQAAKTKEHVEEGKRMKKVGGLCPDPIFPVDPESTPKVGQSAPREFTDFHPTDQEAELQELLEGPDMTFYEDVDASTAVRTADLTDPSIREKEDVKSRLDGMQAVDEADLLGGASGLLTTWLKNRLLRVKLEQPTVSLTSQHVWDLLREARSQGGPELSVAADELLQGVDGNRIGSSVPRATLSTLKWQDGIGSGTLSWDHQHWQVWDFGDKLPPISGWEQTLLQGPTQPHEEEIRQCLVLHCAAGLLHHQGGVCPTLEEVHSQANVLRQDMLQQAREACRQLGPCSEELFAK